jgi:ATP-dependent helicase Lhr and Lhr-like helicase
MSFELLSEPIRKFIYDKGWEQLRPIQVAAITRILSSDDNYILASRTASGKTEAAFLPILSKIDFTETGVQVLYISPLIALINDQFYRIEELCKNLDVTTTKWHGEANKTLKDRLIKEPRGIVLITPESLEAMFVNRPYNVKHLFSSLKYVVIDEIHSFIGTDRGVQLMSILSRLQAVQVKQFSIVGLSATIGDYDDAKRFTGNESKTKVLLDKTAKEVDAVFRFFKSEKDELPIELLQDIYIETRDRKALIFPNSRGRTEEVAVKLRKISERSNGHPNYFSHHSSVDRHVREYVEYFAKNNNRQSFCIVCTSTLELGIDIGTVDEVVQIDSTHSISSLIQRVGRSGRKEGEKSNLYLYATNSWSLLQSMACWLLYKEGFIEPPAKTDNPYDILVHQALSIVKGHSGIKLNDLIQSLKSNFAFRLLEHADIGQILNHLIEIDFLEKIQFEVIIGIEGEKVVNSRDFYSVFKREEVYQVVAHSNKVGEVPFSPQIVEDENILLSARIWKIKLVDHQAKKIEVIPAKDGKKPRFFGSGISVHQRIRERMLDIVYSEADYDFLDQSSLEELRLLKKEFGAFNIQESSSQRPLLVTEKRLTLFTFTGTRINRTIQLLLNIAGIKNSIDDHSSSLELECSWQEVLSAWGSLLPLADDMDSHILELLQKSPGVLDFSSWGIYLPQDYQVKLLKQKYFDFEQTVKFLEKTELITNLQGSVHLRS